MKTPLISLVCLCFAYAGFGQWSIGPKVSFGTIVQTSEDIRIIPFSNERPPNITFIGGGTVKSVGFMLQNSLGHGFLQIEGLGTAYSLQFSSEDQLRSTAEPTMHNEDHVIFELPISAGFRIKNFKIGAGPLLEFKLSKDSELESISRYEDTSRNFNTGAQGLVGYKVGKFDIDLRYVYRFSSIVDDFAIGHDILKLNRSANRLTLSFGMSFGKPKVKEELPEEELLPLAY